MHRSLRSLLLHPPLNGRIVGRTRDYENRHEVRWTDAHLEWSRNLQSDVRSSRLPPDPSFQCYAGKGPIPEGTYSITLREDTHPARDDGTDMCMLTPSSRLLRSREVRMRASVSRFG